MANTSGSGLGTGIAASEPLLTVDLAAVASNTQLLAARAGRQLMAVVKADGFGHGGADVARTALAHGASWLGVTSVGEGMSLRREGIAAPMLSWLNSVDADFGAAIRQHIDLAVPGVEHLHAIAVAAQQVGERADVHLHIDVGMARDGAEPAAWSDLCSAAKRMQDRGLVRVVGVMGHLGRADDPGDVSNRTGRRVFRDAIIAAHQAGLQPARNHLAATAATLTDRRTHFDLCRVGAGLVGIDPSRTTRLRSAMTLTAPVVSVRAVPRGTAVGYGRTYRTPRATRLALISLGYADGIPRAASGRASVQLWGRRLPVVGLVSMDQLVVDVGSTPVRAGDTATIFGSGGHGEPTVAEWARWAGTIEHEIVTGIGQRVRRRTLAAAAPQATVGAAS